MRYFNYAMFALWALGLAFELGSIWNQELVRLAILCWAMPAGAYAGVAAARLGW